MRQNSDIYGSKCEQVQPRDVDISFEIHGEAVEDNVSKVVSREMRKILNQELPAKRTFTQTLESHSMKFDSFQK